MSFIAFLLLSAFGFLQQLAYAINVMNQWSSGNAIVKTPQEMRERVCFSLRANLW